VDEYQDCNQLQIDIVNALQGGRGRQGGVTVVGDDRQAIYGFRGSMPGVFQLFVVGAGELLRHCAVGYASSGSGGCTCG
jgi:hypothetical protein